MSGVRAYAVNCLPAVIRSIKRFLFLVFFFPGALVALEIGPLPENLRARARVIENERDGLWEKSLVVAFAEKRKAISTQEGFVNARAAVNHAMHPLLSQRFMGGKTGRESWRRYIGEIHGKIARDLKASRRDLVTMGTAADMDNLAIATREYGPFTVTALVTAGAETNAVRTGVDEGKHIEPSHGTINILLLTNARLSEGAMARAIITITEAKTAALEDLKVPSSYTKNVQATGTGTDSVVVVTGTDGPRVTYTGGHSRIGELIGKAAYAAVIEALGKQNGFLLPGATPYVTKNSLRKEAAFGSAEKWLLVVDNGDFAPVWENASAFVKRTKNHDAWLASIAAARSGLGKTLGRKTSRHLHTKALPDLPRGEYMLLEFVSVFEHRPESVVESITALQDEDGVWRVIDYSIKNREGKHEK